MNMKPNNDSLKSTISFEELKGIVESEFTIEEALMEHGIPTFFISAHPQSNKAFLRLIDNLDSFRLLPVIRDQDGKIVLQIVPKPEIKSSRRIINWILLLATIGTTLITGYSLSGDLTNPLGGAAMFTIALLAILGSHEMGHTIAARFHKVESTLPYFIPGPPWPLGIGTFGAVIQQKSLAPNRDSLFDLGATGPITGFIVTIIVTVIGLQLSSVHHTTEMLPSLPVPLLFELIANAIVNLPPSPVSEPYTYILLHPVAFAGWVGMLVTTIQLVPIGMLDGGHVVRSLFGQRARRIFTFLSVMIFLILGQFVMAIFAFMLSLRRHPGPLDDVTKLGNSRKLVAILLVLVFLLCATSFWFSF